VSDRPTPDPAGMNEMAGLIPAPRAVTGYCPMGCGQTLNLIAGTVLCTAPDCPDCQRLTTIMADQECEHIVELGEARFTVKHPLRERANDELLTCGIDAAINAAGIQAGGPPAPPGTYRVRFIDGTLSFQQLTPGGQ